MICSYQRPRNYGRKVCAGRCRIDIINNMLVHIGNKSLGKGLLGTIGAYEGLLGPIKALLVQVGSPCLGSKSLYELCAKTNA